MAGDTKSQNIGTVTRPASSPVNALASDPINDPDSGPKRNPHTILSEKEKIFTIIIVSSMNVLIYFSDTMYYQILDTLSTDLNVSLSKMYMTLTAYMLAQGIAPLFTGPLSDLRGRRPVLLACLLVSVATNIGLACQSNFATLLFLRCLQSFATSGALVVTIATVIDIVARSERGKYMAYTTIGSTIGTSVGPVLGGALTQFKGWRSVFWLLAIFSGLMIVIIMTFLQETCRAIVGDGSIPPQRWNVTLISSLRAKSAANRQATIANYHTRTALSKRPRILDSLKLILDKQLGLLIVFWCLVSWGQTAVEISIPILMRQKYGFNSLQVGLCYIPWAIGGIVARWTVGNLADWNFRRLGRQVGVDIQRNQPGQSKEDLDKMPLEKIRLQIFFPTFYLCCLFLTGYSWAISVGYKVHVACPLVLLFFLGNTFIGGTNVLAALIMDGQCYQPGTTRASMTMYRCLPNAGIIAAVNPAIGTIGFGWLGTIFAASWLLSSSVLWIIYLRGQQWRQQQSRGN